MSTYYYLIYLKIHKTDVLSSDISLFIRDAINLKLKYTDISPLEFEIVNITEFSTYYLCQIKFQGYGNINTLASSSDNNILDYKTYLEKRFNPTVIPLGNSSASITYDVTPGNGNDYGWMNTTTGFFTFENTPNVILSFTSSVTASSPSSTSYQVLLYNATTLQSLITSPTVSIPAGGTGSVYFSGSFSSSISGDRICLRLNHLGNYTTEQITIQSCSFALASSCSAGIVTNSGRQSIPPNVGISSSGDLLLITSTGLSSDNPLYGNYVDFSKNSKYTLLPPDVFIPTIEFNNILSGSGTRATVNQYNYELRRNIYPRYKGSRSTSDGFNTSSISQSSLIQSSSNIYLNPVNDGFSPANSYNTTIFEFAGGNNSGPEIPNLGRIDITQILNIDNTESVDYINPTDISFSETIKTKLYKGIKPNINQYNSTAYIDPSTKILVNDITPVPVFMITSYPQEWSTATSSINNVTGSRFLESGCWYKIQNYSTGDDFRRICWGYEGTVNEDGFIFQIPGWITASVAEFGGNLESKLSASVTWSNGTQLQKLGTAYNNFYIPTLNNTSLWGSANYVNIDENGYYNPQGFINIENISKSMADGFQKGVRWFYTLYQFPFTAPINVNNLTRYPNTYTSSGDLEKYPLGANSAYEIKDILTTIFPSQSAIEFTPKNPELIDFSRNINFTSSFQFKGGQGQQGMIIWKSEPNSNSLILSNPYLNQLGDGNILPPNSSPTITNNLTYITKTFGNKK